MTERTIYIGKDLEAMSFAENYHRWILDEFRPYISQHVVEVGAGTGSFSQLLLDEGPQSLTLIEPSDMFLQLEKNIAAVETGSLITLHNSTFRDAAAEISKGDPPDTILYVNVLEHIQDDLGELQAVYDVLAPGGHCLIFVPALQSLYGEFDRRVGHFRRYSKPEIEAKCRDAGFSIKVSKYFDLPGVVPWFVKYRVLRSDELSPAAVSLYDCLAVPLVLRFESVISVPLGKNVLIAAEKAP